MTKAYAQMNRHEKGIRLTGFRKEFCKVFCDLPYRNQCEAHCLINYLTIDNANKIRLKDVLEVRK